MRPTDQRFLLTLFSVLAFSWTAVADETPKKVVIPSEKAQSETLKLIKEVYGEDYANAKTTAEKQALAKKLLDKAGETTDDPVAKYVLLGVSRDISIQAADFEAAFQAIDSLAESYPVNVAELKQAALTKAAAAAKTVPQYTAIAEASLKAAAGAVAGDDFTTADQLATLALGEARKARDKTLIAQAQREVEEVARSAKAFEAVAAAKASLEKNADDADANTVMGKYLCFVKADWEKGLPMLARGNNNELKTLAEKELAKAVSSADQVKLGDGWWDVAEKEKSEARKPMRARAVYWYQAALPELHGLAGDKVKMRIEQSTSTKSEEVGETGKTDQWISRDATYRASSVYDEQRQALPSLLNESENYHSDEYAFATKQEAGAHIVIDLGKRMTITRIYIQNRSKPDLYYRAKGLTVWLSEDAEKEGTAVWTAPSPAAEWDVVLRRPRTARYIKIGLPPQLAGPFNLKKVKVFGKP